MTGDKNTKRLRSRCKSLVFFYNLISSHGTQKPITAKLKQDFTLVSSRCPRQLPLFKLKEKTYKLTGKKSAINKFHGQKTRGVKVLLDFEKNKNR